MEMMEQLFLFGDVSTNFGTVSKPFIRASGGADARIALLLQGGQGWERFVPRYRDPWMRVGAEEVVPIVPTDDYALEEKAVRSINECTGIFVAGGDTEIYHRVYASEKIGSIIRSRYREGIPYGGVSAGAIIAPETCILQGGLAPHRITSFS